MTYILNEYKANLVCGRVTVYGRMFTCDGDVLPFGGINVRFVGDLWQLDKPKGGFLATITVEYIRRASKNDRWKTNKKVHETHK